MKNANYIMDADHGKDKLIITCVERKYRVLNSNVGFVIVSKKELDENVTQELLDEDIEIKTFLENHPIIEMVPLAAKSIGVDSINIDDKNISKENINDASIDRIMTNKNRSRLRRDESIVTHQNVNGAKQRAMKRRELFDDLNLSERFTTRDYKDELRKKGIEITNTAMPYDDLDWLEKQGKIKKDLKNKSGPAAFVKLKSGNSSDDDNNMRKEVDNDVNSDDSNDMNNNDDNNMREEVENHNRREEVENHNRSK